MGTTNLQLYTKADVYVNGALLMEETNVSVDRSTNSIQTITAQRGYAGETPGAPMCEISVDNATPSAAFELDPGQFMSSMQSVSFTIRASGKKLSFEGFMLTDNFSHSANAESKLSFTARGVFSEWTS